MHFSTRHVRFGLAAFLLIALLLDVVPTIARQQMQSAPQPIVYIPLISILPGGHMPSPIEQEAINLINQQRTLHSCPQLGISIKLSDAAYRHSSDMALGDLFSHDGSDGSTMVSRILDTGYTYSQLAENIAAGDSTAQAVVSHWMGSTMHRNNIWNCGLRDAGIGYYYQADDQPNVRLFNGQIGGPFYHYWTLDLGTP